MWSHDQKEEPSMCNLPVLDGEKTTEADLSFAQPVLPWTLVKAYLSVPAKLAACVRIHSCPWLQVQLCSPGTKYSGNGPTFRITPSLKHQLHICNVISGRVAWTQHHNTEWPDQLLISSSPAQLCTAQHSAWYSRSPVLLSCSPVHCSVQVCLSLSVFVSLSHPLYHALQSSYSLSLHLYTSLLPLSSTPTLVHTLFPSLSFNPSIYFPLSFLLFQLLCSLNSSSWWYINHTIHHCPYNYLSHHHLPLHSLPAGSPEDFVFLQDNIERLEFFYLPWASSKKPVERALGAPPDYHEFACKQHYDNDARYRIKLAREFPEAKWVQPPSCGRPPQANTTAAWLHVANSMTPMWKRQDNGLMYNKLPGKHTTQKLTCISESMKRWILGRFTKLWHCCWPAFDWQCLKHCEHFWALNCTCNGGTSSKQGTRCSSASSQYMLSLWWIAFSSTQRLLYASTSSARQNIV